MQPTGSTAIYIPVCPSRCPCHVQNRRMPHHLTLVHLWTNNPKIINKAVSKIKNLILNNQYLSQDVRGRKVVSYTLGNVGPNSTWLNGDVEKFKNSIYTYLKRDPKLAPYMSPYRNAHVDRYNQNLNLYPVFRVENLKVFSRSIQ